MACSKQLRDAICESLSELTWQLPSAMIMSAGESRMLEIQDGKLVEIPPSAMPAIHEAMQAVIDA
jgi:hypothetical protein